MKCRTVQPPFRPSLEDWKLYIKQPVVFANTPKEGGVCYEDAKNELLKEANDILDKRDKQIKADRKAYIFIYLLTVIIAVILSIIF